MTKNDWIGHHFMLIMGLVLVAAGIGLLLLHWFLARPYYAQTVERQARGGPMLASEFVPPEGSYTVTMPSNIGTGDMLMMCFEDTRPWWRRWLKPMRVEWPEGWSAVDTPKGGCVAATRDDGH